MRSLIPVHEICCNELERTKPWVELVDTDEVILNSRFDCQFAATQLTSELSNRDVR